LKRIVREAFRQRRSDIGARADVVIIAKPGAERLSGGAAAAEVVRALELALG
jgi:ribonuclease P protein component